MYRLILDSLYSVQPTGHDRHLMSFTSERLRQDLTHSRIIINHENM